MWKWFHYVKFVVNLKATLLSEVMAEKVLMKEKIYNILFLSENLWKEEKYGTQQKTFSFCFHLVFPQYTLFAPF